MGLLDAPNPVDGFGNSKVAGPRPVQLCAQTYNIPNSAAAGTVFGQTAVSYPIQRSARPRLHIWVTNASLLTGLEFHVAVTDLLGSTVHPSAEKFYVKPNNGSDGQGFLSEGIPGGNAIYFYLKTLAAGEATGLAVNFKVYSI